MKLELMLARLGWTAVLAILLTASVALNAWQFNRAGKADARCASRIADMVADVDRVTAAREVKAIEIARETTADAQAESTRIQSDTIKIVERIREVPVPVPAECDGPMPDRVRDTLADAARAANRSM
jgi:predicted GTPase